MKYELAPLGYAANALEPHIDEQTMNIHHDKHHAAYVTNLNAALDKHPEIADTPLLDLIKNLGGVPEDIRAAVRNNGGGHINHDLFWRILKPGGAKAPSGKLADAIAATFGSVDALKEKINDAGKTRFGSGWTWLVLDAAGKLSVVSTANQDNPQSDGLRPVLGIDVWEHAYYLRYQNRRPDYLTAVWNVVNWDVVGEMYDNFTK